MVEQTFNYDSDFPVHECYRLYGEMVNLQRAESFIENWYDNRIWQFDCPNDMQGLLLDLMEHFDIYDPDWRKKYSQSNGWIDNYGLEDELGYLEIITMGCMKDQKDVIEVLCKCFGLHYTYETF